MEKWLFITRDIFHRRIKLNNIVLSPHGYEATQEPLLFSIKGHLGLSIGSNKPKTNSTSIYIATTTFSSKSFATAPN